MNPDSKATAGFLNQLFEFGEMIKISHTLFALPFAIGAAFLAISLQDSQLLASGWTPFLQVVLAIAFARTSAMSFNRWADRDIDGKNPRTENRSIPAGRLTAGQVLTATVISIFGFVATCAWIGDQALLLSPIVLLVVLGYSYTKRVTWLCHTVLGIGLGLAPVGAWLVLTGDLSNPLPWILGTAVLFWSSGFDIVYSCQDVEVDTAQSLNSIPARFGIAKSLIISRAFHVVMILLMGLLYLELNHSLPVLIATLMTAILLSIGHLRINAEYRKLKRIENALLEFNIAISVIFMLCMVAEVYL